MTHSSTCAGPQLQGYSLVASKNRRTRRSRLSTVSALQPPGDLLGPPAPEHRLEHRVLGAQLRHARHEL